MIPRYACSGALKTKPKVTDAFAVVTARCVRFLVAADADDALIRWCKFLVADWLMTLVTLETFFVPFPAFVLEFLHSYNNFALPVWNN